MARRTKEAAPRNEQKWQEADTVIQELQQVLQRQKDARFQPVKIWLNRINEERGVAYMGIALGEALGCSPFCGCAAKQIGDQFEPFLLERLSWLNRVVVEAEAPPESDHEHEGLLLKLL